MNKNEIDEMINFLQTASKYLDEENENEKADFETKKLFDKIANRASNENGKIVYFKSLFEPEIVKRGFGIAYDIYNNKYYAYNTYHTIPVGIVIFKSKFLADLCADWLNYELSIDGGDNCKK